MLSLSVYYLLYPSHPAVLFSLSGETTNGLNMVNPMTAEKGGYGGHTANEW